MAPTTPNVQFSCLSVEDIVHGIPYSITLNPCDALQSWDKLYSVRFDECLRAISMLIDKAKPYSRVVGFMEISKGGRFHFHGTITFNNDLDIFKFFCEVPHKWQKVCTYELDTIKDKTVWQTYITKQSRFYPDEINKIDSKKLSVLPDGKGNMKVRHSKSGQNVNKRMTEYVDSSDSA